ncbi:MAG: DUF3786 domain-containing protein, partial [Oscillospiraceae bacterium]|nr:DUF3786 domain-containing protein [Oscillospiraceae bacterium]
MEARADAYSRQFPLMLKPARERLSAYSPQQLCEKGGITFDALSQQFLFPSLGKSISVSYPEFIINEKLNPWHHLTLLQYMDTADATPLTNRLISLSDMPGGLSRGHGFNKDIDTMFSRWFTNISAEQFKVACLKLGGKLLEEKADATVCIPYAPRFPITLCYYEGDDEFPPSGKALVDSNAHHYLTIEAAGGACAAVVQTLAE